MAGDETHAGVIESISSNLGAFFRHLFPGVVIVGATCVAYPSWFLGKFDARSWQHIVVLGVIALTVGNVLFVFNRYALHQVADYLLYKGGTDGPRPAPNSDYFTDLGKYVAEAVCAQNIPKEARQHIAFRASSVLLLYIVAEMSAIFYFWHESSSWFARHPRWTITCGVLAGIAAAGQNVITRHIDFHVVDLRRRK